MNGDEDLGQLYRRAIDDLPGGQLDPAHIRLLVRRRRRKQVVAAGALAVTAAVAVVAVPALQRPYLVAEPAASTSAHPTPNPSATTPAQPNPNKTVVALSAVQTEAVIQRCRATLGVTAAVRRVDLAAELAVAGSAVLFTDKNSVSYACDDLGSRAYDGPAASPTTHDRSTLSRSTPVERIASGGLQRGVDPDGALSARTTRAYRVAGSVYRVQVRVVAGKVPGPWFDAAVHDGYAYGGAQTTISSTTRQPAGAEDLAVEDRAFDQAGDELTITGSPR